MWDAIIDIIAMGQTGRKTLLTYISMRDSPSSDNALFIDLPFNWLSLAKSSMIEIRRKIKLSKINIRSICVFRLIRTSSIQVFQQTNL